MSFEKKCVCTYNCDDLELLQTNREADNNKENILQVAENEDLLEVESGVPTKNPTKLYPKRDTTKLDRKDFEDYKKDLEDYKEDLEDYKEVINLNINNKANQSALERFANYTTNQLELKADKTEIPDLSEYAKKEDIPEEADLSNYATKTELNTKADKTEIPDLSDYAKKEDIPEGADLSNYAKKEELNLKADKTEIPDLSDYAKKEDIPEDVDLSNYAKKEELNLKADKTEIPDLSDYAKKEDIPEGADLSNYATKGELNLKADKTDLSNYLTIEDARDEHERRNGEIIEINKNLNLKPDTYSIKESTIVKNDIKVIYHIIKIFDTNSSINIKGLDSLFPSGFSNYTKIVEFLPINKFGYTLKSFSISTNHVVYNITNIDSERRPLLMRLTITPGDNLTYITGIERE